MESPRHLYRKFVFGSAAKSADGLYYALTGARHGRPIRLEPAEFELARLIDGSRDAAAVRASARAVLGAELTPAELERFCNELATSDLLAAGSQEPLPVPAQTDAEATLAGWNRGPRPAGVGSDTAAPSTVPGSLTGPGLPGSLTGLWGAFRGVVAAPRVVVPTTPFLPLGLLLNLPLFGLLTLLVLTFLVVGAVVAMWTHRIEMGVDFVRIVEPLPLLFTLLGGVYLVNFLSEIARASVIQTLTRQKPLFGIVLGTALIPRFHCDTGGAAESAPRAQRLRIVGSSLIAQLVIFVIAVLLWLVFQHSHSVLPSLLVSLALIASAFFFLQLNPLVKRDGYNWLVQWYQAADLREQAMYALFGHERPWNEMKKLSPGVLRWYGFLVLAYTVWLMVWVVIFPARWLSGAFGAAGIVITALLLAWSVYTSTRRSQASRGSIGAGKVNLAPPKRFDWAIIAVLVTICLFPYTYEPSGEFVVLPAARADVRALTDGDVREVFVKEGETVAKGQVVAKLNDDAERYAVASSEANLTRLRANMSVAKAGAKGEEIDQARQLVATAEKKLEFSRAEANRLKKAFMRKAVSDQDYQRALSVAEIDQQRLLEARKQLALVISPVRNEQLQSLEAEIASEQAKLDLAQKSVEYAQVKSPIAGRILSGTLRFALGDFLQRGAQLAMVEDSSKLLVEIRVPETDIGKIEVGDKAVAKTWAFPDRGYTGIVREIAPSAEISQYGRVVRVVMSIEETDGKLLPQMTGYAKVEAERMPLIVAYTRPVVRFFLVEFWSWLP
ncbi:HlyD family efflux transporter periplasmic adaptor subunit [Nevskia sp.]|uniref:HlyD family secretion protein n=1 Tax=Nevskia sp. TaxID=1929292 RepID=UPI0025F33ED5|nr:HlyD family efflux transporter periplasmic adaptor subunit [Nevskia sp.]